MGSCKKGKQITKSPKMKPTKGKAAAAKAIDILVRNLLHLLNICYIIDDESQGMLVACEKCKKWRNVKEYEESSEVPENFDCSMWNLSEEEKGNCYIPQLQDESDDSKFTNESYTPGSLVWVTWRRNERWPAMIEDDPGLHLYCRNPENPEYHFVYFGAHQRRWSPEKLIEPFTVPSQDEMPSKSRLREAIEEAMIADGMPKKARLLAFSFGERKFRKKTAIKYSDDWTSYSRLQPSAGDYAPCDLVWVEREQSIRWPGMVIYDPMLLTYYKEDEEMEYHICLFDDENTRYWVKKSFIEPFSMPYASVFLNEMIPDALEKALSDAEKAMKKTVREKLMDFIASVLQETAPSYADTRCQMVHQRPEANSSPIIQTTVNAIVVQTPKASQDGSVTRDLQLVPQSFIDENMKNLSKYYQETEEQTAARRMYEKHLFLNYKPLFNRDGSIAT